MWYDPLTRKKFSSEAKYREATGSKKYQELVRCSGAPAPEPIVTLRKAPATGVSEGLDSVHWLLSSRVHSGPAGSLRGFLSSCMQPGSAAC